MTAVIVITNMLLIVEYPRTVYNQKQLKLHLNIAGSTITGKEIIILIKKLHGKISWAPISILTDLL